MARAKARKRPARPVRLAVLLDETSYQVLLAECGRNGLPPDRQAARLIDVGLLFLATARKAWGEK